MPRACRVLPATLAAALVVVLAAVPTAPAGTQDEPRAIPVQARPVAVTVHPSQATVTRGGAVDVPAEARFVDPSPAPRDREVGGMER